MRSLCIDPGLRACGAGVFHGDHLIRAALVTNPKVRGRGPEAHLVMARAVAAWWFDFYDYFPDNLFLEFPVIYPGSQGRKGDPNDLLDLAGVDGAIAALLEPTTELTMYLPSQWKGSVDADVMTERIRNALSDSERNCIVTAGAKDHNTLDAVGIGLYRFGRLTRKVYPR